MTKVQYLNAAALSTSGKACGLDEIFDGYGRTTEEKAKRSVSLVKCAARYGYVSQSRAGDLLDVAESGSICTGKGRDAIFRETSRCTGAQSSLR